MEIKVNGLTCTRKEFRNHPPSVQEVNKAEHREKTTNALGPGEGPRARETTAPEQEREAQRT